MKILFYLILIAPPIARADVTYTQGCTLYDEHLIEKIISPGENCSFLKDGSVISLEPEKKTLAKYSAKGTLVWQKKNILSHQSISLSQNKKNLLILASEAADEGFCTARHVVFLAIDIKTGKIKLKKNSRDFRKELYEKTNFFLLKELPAFGKELGTDCRATQFNSINEIPENSLSKEIPAFSKGNFILTNEDSHYIFILNKTLEKILWAEAPFSNQVAPYQKTRVLADGKIVFLMAADLSPSQEKRFAAFKYDPQTHLTTSDFPLQPLNIEILEDSPHVLPQSNKEGSLIFFLGPPNRVARQYELRVDL